MKPKAAVRMDAADALGKIGVKDPAAVTALAGALTDSSVFVRLSAAAAQRADGACGVHSRACERPAHEDVHCHGEPDPEPADVRSARVHRGAEDGEEQQEREDRLDEHGGP